MESFLMKLMLFLFSDIKIFPVWASRSNVNLAIADAGSKPIPTDEWQLAEEDFQRITQALSVIPTVDAFATKTNTKCEKYFSRIPEASAWATDFFIQTLQPKEIYYLVPPIKEVTRTWFALTNVPNITAVLVVPAWYSASFYPLFREKTCFNKFIEKHFEFKAAFRDSDHTIFNSEAKFNMLALLIRT